MQRGTDTVTVTACLEIKTELWTDVPNPLKEGGMQLNDLSQVISKCPT